MLALVSIIFSPDVALASSVSNVSSTQMVALERKLLMVRQS